MADEKIKVYLVDGRKVRDCFKTDFVEGGHDLVYPWIPPNEVWIEQSLDDDEKADTLLHEMTERTLMKQGYGYDESHREASKVEFIARQHRGTFNVSREERSLPPSPPAPAPPRTRKVREVVRDKNGLITRIIEHEEPMS